MAEARDPEFSVASEAPDGSSGSGSGSISGSISGSGSRRAEKRYQLSSMGLSVDSCLSAGELCEIDQQLVSAISDSVYSTVSDVTLVGSCRCPEGAPCRCGAGQGTAEVSTSTDSGTSLRDVHTMEDTTAGAFPREEQACSEKSGPLPVGRSEESGYSDVRKEKESQPSAGSVSGDQEPILPNVTVSVGSALSAAGATECGESTPPAPSDSDKPDPVAPAAGSDPGLHVPGPERVRRLSLDSSGLTAAFRQKEQFEELNDAEDEKPRSFTVSTEARQSQSRSTSASESHSDPAGGEEGPSSPGYDLEEALYQFHHQRSDSYASSPPSDVSVQELELETTGDFPHDFQFRDVGGSSLRSPAVWPDEAEGEERRTRRSRSADRQRPDEAEGAERRAWRSGSADRQRARRQLDSTLSDQPRRGAEGSASAAQGVPVVVVEPAEEPTAAVPSAPRSPAVRRGFLARLVDSTAAFLLGGMQDDGGDRRHRSYTVSASDYRSPPAAAAAAAAVAAARRAAAAAGGDPTSASGGDPTSASGGDPTSAAGGDPTSASGGDPTSAPSSARTLSPPRSPTLSQVETPAPCRQRRERSCSPEVVCHQPLARRRRPATRDTERNGELLVPPRPLGGSDEGADNYRSQASDDKSDERRKMRQQSMQNELRVTVRYHNVKPGETIPSIAAFYQCLPGEVKELNRLQFKKNILPGQVLRILDRRRVHESPKPPEGGGETDQEEPGEGGVSLRRRHCSGPSHSVAPIPDEIQYKQYIQIRRTRLFTESEGVAVGTLMFTPNSMMFRPNVSDPLVMERGVEYYTVDIPVRYLVTAEYYTEPPHHSPAIASQHREAHRESFGAAARDEAHHTSTEDGAAIGSAGTDGAQVALSPARAKRPCSPDSDGGGGPGETAAVGDCLPSPPQSSATAARSLVEPSGPGGLGGAGEPGSGGDSTSPTAAPPAAVAHRSQSSPVRTGEAKRKAYSRGPGSGRASFSAPPPPQEGDECGSPLSLVIPIFSSASPASYGSQRSFPLSASLRSQEGLGADSPTPGDTAPEEVSCDKQPSPGARREKETGSLEGSSSSLRRLKNETPIHEKPSLFKAADELLRVHTPVMSQPPLYLELVTGKARGRRLPRSERAKVMFCGLRRLPSRVLFAVPRESCEQMYTFIRRWAPELCDDLDLAAKLERQDFEQIDSDDDIWEPEELEEDWEKVELRDHRGYPMARDAQAGDAADGPAQQPPPPPPPLDTAFLPELVGRTELLTDEARACLQRNLPARVEGHPWQLVFNTAEHGFSLKTLYRQAVEFDCPMLLVVQDSVQHVFGAVCTDPIRFGKHFYGTGESFLFTLRPQFQAYRWSGENQYFARGSIDCLEFGSGDGRSGLFLDEGLVRGFTEPCQTYNNDPLTTTKEFSINAVELWALG